MPYPQSPFSDGFNTDILCKTGSGVSDGQVQLLNLDLWLRWLCEAPAVSSYRINTLLCSAEEVLERIRDELSRVCYLMGKCESLKDAEKQMAKKELYNFS